MLFWLILAGLGIIGIIVWTIYEQDPDCILLGLLYLAAFTFIAVMISGLFGLAFSADEVYQTEETPICALSDNSDIDGSFFLGSGYVKEDMYYYYLVKNDDGSKEMHKIAATGTPVDDSETENPRIVTEYKRNSNPVVRFFFFTYQESHKIYIPPKSIKYSYNIDLE